MTESGDIAVVPLLRRSRGSRVVAGALSVVAIAGLTTVIADEMFRLGNPPPPRAPTFFAHLILWGVTALALWLFVGCRDRLFALRPMALLPSLGLEVVLVAMYALTVVVTSTWLLGRTVGPPRLPPGMTQELMRPMMVIRSVVLYAITVLSLTSFRLYSQRLDRERRDQERELREARLEEQLTKARLDALRMQVHPHFLFNSLHAIGGLVMDGQQREAHRAIAALGTLLRHSFRLDTELTVSVREEVELLEEYLALEQIRLGRRLRHSIEAEPECLNGRVPPLLLLPIVENAIRHGIAPLPTGGTVVVRVACTSAQIRMTISDNGKGYSERSRHRRTEGVGLSNCIARLENMYGHEGALDISPREPRGTRVTIRIPREPANSVSASMVTS